MQSRIEAPLFAALVVGVFACSPDAMSTSDRDVLGPQYVVTRESSHYEWHAGDAFLGALNPALSPVIARAPNGHTMEIDGTGEIHLDTKSVTGGGTFVHKDQTGATVASGTFTAGQLLTFVSYGSLPNGFATGLALIRIHLSAGFDAVLRITCVLPGIKEPNGFAEGIRLNVQGAINFNQEAGGATVFIVM